MRAARSVALVLAALLLAGCSSPTPVKTETGIFWLPDCTNGSLELDGTTWYPVHVVTDAEMAAHPPTPGSGQGQVTLYSDGSAYWLSMGGLYGTWLTTDSGNFEKACGGSR